MGTITAETRMFSDIVARINTVIRLDNVCQAFLQLVAKFFVGDKGAVLRFRDDADNFETVASLETDDLEISQNVDSWRAKLPVLSKESNSAEQDGYLLTGTQSKPVSRVPEFAQRLARLKKETSLVGYISRYDQTTDLLWLHRNADSPNFVSYDLELLKMVLPHIRQAIELRRQIDNLKKHLRGKGYVA
jgi:hypothetical protein